MIPVIATGPESLLDVVCTSAAWATYRVVLTPFDRVKVLLQVAPEFPIALSVSRSIEYARLCHPGAQALGPLKWATPAPSRRTIVCEHEVERLVHVFRLFDAISLLPPHCPARCDANVTTTATVMVPNSGSGLTAPMEEALAAALRAPRSLVSGGGAHIPTSSTAEVNAASRLERGSVRSQPHRGAKALPASASGGCVTWVNCARYIYRTEGVAGFFRGGGLAVVSQMGQTAAVVTLGSVVRWAVAAVAADPDPRARPVAAMFVSALSAMIAALGVSFVMYPLDLVRFVRQADLRFVVAPACSAFSNDPTARRNVAAVTPTFEHPKSNRFLREVVGGKFAPSCIHPQSLVQAWSAAAATRDELVATAADGSRTATRARATTAAGSTQHLTPSTRMSTPADFLLRGGGACLYRGFGLGFTTLALQRALFFFTYDVVARVVLPMAERADAARLERWACEEQRRMMGKTETNAAAACAASSDEALPTEKEQATTTAKNESGALPRPPQPLPQVLIEGVVTFGVAALGTALLYPLDTLRCRYVRRGFSTVHTVAHGAFGRYDAAVQSPWAQAVEIAKREGVRSFYRGFGFAVFVRGAWITAAGLMVPRLAQSFKTQIRHSTTASASLPR